MIERIGGWLVVMAALTALAQEPVTVARNVFQDDLLAKIDGKWKLEGSIRGKPAQRSVEARWILNHQFLQINEIGTAGDKPVCEAIA